MDTFLFDRKFEQYNLHNKVGLAALVIQNDITLFRKGYGLRNLETGEAVTAETNFRLASVSKQFTAMCIAILEEQGKLSITDSITKYFTGYPPCLTPVTIAHLLYHTSGLPECYDDLCSTNQARPLAFNTDVYHFYKNIKHLDFAAGHRFEYSNGGYNLLATIIEKASGKTFTTFLTEQIFTPLGMLNSRTYNPPFEIPYQAISYSGWPFFENMDFDTGNTLLGEGGIYSSINDMEKWISALENHSLVSSTMMEKIFTPGTDNSGEMVNYGYGWEFNTYEHYKHIYHTGGWVGFNSVIAHFPEKQLWVVCLANSPAIDTWNAMEDIVSELLDITN
ncbi:MAG TPA: serine hydrolase domain-containing protein [Cellvibrio sp.]|nr:serine hydrolase domain-containing protein [Cellvibrio sp.]